MVSALYCRQLVMGGVCWAPPAAMLSAQAMYSTLMMSLLLLQHIWVCKSNRSTSGLTSFVAIEALNFKQFYLIQLVKKS